jgi:serine beta-lactamase-like protein LACTB
MVFGKSIGKTSKLKLNMKLGIQIVLLFAILAGISGCKKQTGRLLYDKKYKDDVIAIREEVRYYILRNQIPGTSVAVAKDGKLIYSEGMGTASKDLDVLVTRKTKFRIAQLSELFTSFIYLKMVEEGKLHPDSSVQHYLPDFPKKNYPLRLNHLINHTSGIREAEYNEEKWDGINISIQKGLEKFKDDALDAIPGRYQTKSMYDYNLMGAIMEKAVDKRFNKILKEYLTDTFKLTNTVIDNPFSTIKNRTNFYDQSSISQIINASFYDLRYRAPAQGILSNADDLVKLGNAILFSDYLSDETKNKMFEAIPLADGIPSQLVNGWMLYADQQGNEIYGRSGMVKGGSASVLIYPKLKLVIASVTNLNTGLSDTPVFKILEHFITPPKEEDQEAID